MISNHPYKSLNPFVNIADYKWDTSDILSISGCSRPCSLASSETF